MRVTAETRQTTRQAILEAAERLFRSQGFEQTTTRDLAREAGIAVGTLFNYFPTKEAIVMQLVTDSLETAVARFPKRRRGGASLEEDLFLFVTTGLRSLKPLREFLQPALDTGFSPAAGVAGDMSAARVDHLERMTALLAEHGLHEPPSALQLQMYWMLYVGVLSFWAKDGSPKQEDTLAMLDQSIDMFVGWLRGPIDNKRDVKEKQDQK
jgi:AcrR family transcriptional regulator